MFLKSYKSLKLQGGSASVDFIIADLRQLKSVSKCAHELIARKRLFDNTFLISELL